MYICYQVLSNQESLDGRESDSQAGAALILTLIWVHNFLPFDI